MDAALFVLIGSLLPDIDHPKSVVGRWFFFVSWFCKHRGICHTIIGCAVLASPFLLLSQTAFIFVFYGAIGHLIGDFIWSSVLGKSHFKVKLW